MTAIEKIDIELAIADAEYWGALCQSTSHNYSAIEAAKRKVENLTELKRNLKRS